MQRFTGLVLSSNCHGTMLFNCPDPRAGTDDSVALREFIYSAGAWWGLKLTKPKLVETNKRT